jgi:predicted aminopeptidase
MESAWAASTPATSGPGGVKCRAAASNGVTMQWLMGISRKRLGRAWLPLTGLLLAAAALALSANSEARFVARSGWQEGRILLARRPLAEVASDPRTPGGRRAQLELVLAARDFAARRLGLAAKNTYTTFSEVGSGPLLYVLSASPRDRLAAYLWHYPLVGGIPYKGFFSAAEARVEERRLARAGYDTYLRPADAFSTLGWFDDPLLSTVLDGDPAELVATVIHEISHNTVWVPGAAPFNESFADFVGMKGAEAFFAGRGDRATAARCAALWRDEVRLGAFYGSLAARLEALYDSGLAGPALAARRQRLFGAARADLAGPFGRRLEVYSGAALARRPLNNAALVAERIYRTDLAQFDRLLDGRGDLRAGVAAIRRALRRPGTRGPRQVLASLAARATPAAVTVR